MADEKKMTLAEALEAGLLEKPVHPEILAAAVAAGDVKEELAFVTVKQEGACEIKEPYVKLISQNDAGSRAIVVGSGIGEDKAVEEVASSFTYGWDLYVRSLTRQRVEARLEGPDKAILKAATDGFKAGAYASVAEGVEEIKARRKARGLDQ
jgi:hypothetical protein